jgi:hypothetical protein
MQSGLDQQKCQIYIMWIKINNKTVHDCLTELFKFLLLT